MFLMVLVCCFDKVWSVEQKAVGAKRNQSAQRQMHFLPAAAALFDQTVTIVLL